MNIYACGDLKYHKKENTHVLIDEPTLDNISE